MCGIMAIRGKGAVSGVLSGLKALEYRGYDSCGVACRQKGGKLVCNKALGYVENLKNCKGKLGKTSLAIGHTRWATHGGVTLKNCHPHFSGSGRFAIVHNGIIENFESLKEMYLSDEQFSSQTDSEVVARLMDKFFNGNVLETFKTVVSKISGTYAIVLISSYDDCMYFARSFSPLVFGQCSNGLCLSSDIVGLKSRKKVFYIPDNSIGYVDNEIHVFDKNNELVPINFVSVDDRKFKPKTFPHYMLSEIYDIPRAILDTTKSLKQVNIKIPYRVSNVLICGCGTSYHSGLCGKMYFESIAKIPATCYIASEFESDFILPKKNTLGIFISQSGETADTISALLKAKDMGIYTVAITNVASSTITTLADEVILMSAGVEVCVASTKAYTTQVFLLYALAKAVASFKKNKVAKSKADFVFLNLYDAILENLNDIEKLSHLDISKIFDSLEGLETELKDCVGIHLIGKGQDFVTAMEGGLKIKEVTYKFTDAYPCGELKHGTLSLISVDSYVLAIATDENLVSMVSNCITEISSRGGKVIVISNLEKNNFTSAHRVISVPSVDKLLMPIVAVVPIFLLAYKMSVSLGINPDRPKNLAKSVTVK